MNQPERSFTQVQNLKTAQVVIGEGQPVIMLHGWGASIDLMWPLAEKLASSGYQIYALDLPGFGQSQKPSSAWSVYDYARFVIAYLDCHDLDKVHLIGHSFGGRLGLILGSDYPERISKMALFDSAGVRPRPPAHQQLRLKGYKFAQAKLRSVGLSKVADQLGMWYRKRYGSSDYQNASGIMRETFVKVVNEDLLPHAARVKPSTLLFWGDQDEDTPLWQGQMLEKTIPDAGLVVFEGAGHYSYLDRLGDAARIVDHFFGGGL
jgi:pimeloyl-ACP methyl ester carboxylesterase